MYDMVAPGEEFTFSGSDKRGILGTETSVCVDGYSRNGGRLCPADGGSDCGCDCEKCTNHHGGRHKGQKKHKEHKCKQHRHH